MKNQWGNTKNSNILFIPTGFYLRLCGLIDSRCFIVVRYRYTSLGKETAMKQHRQRNGQEGIAMIIVVCIMAVLVMMSLALLLASSVMTQNAGRVKDQEQSRILAVSLADELEKELTVTPSQQEKTQASGTILEFVNSKIISGSWPSGEEQTFSLDSSALNQANELSAQATLSWEEGENGYTDASLYITVHCIYHNMPFSVTTIYNAYTAYATDDENQNEDVQDTLYWIRSERR